jgi:hypothetical protein
MPEIGPAFLPGTVMPVYEAPMIRSAMLFVGVLALTACGAQPAADSSTMGVVPRGGDKAGGFPTHPDLSVTPGVLCKDADETRYPEHIKYCSRDVGSGLKKDIINQYDEDFGYQIESMPRTDFKIDHFLPLCMGGANDRANLWPQHKSVYVLTDGIEMKLCQLMAFGEMKQTEAVENIKRIKFNLDQAPAYEAQLDARIHGRQSGH